MLHTKILVQSYIHLDFQKIVNNVPYLKYLKINHGVRFFKTNLGLFEFSNLNINKRNIISTSPYEYELFIKYFNYSENYIYKAGLPRYDRFQNIKKKKSERNCILMTFTYRSYNNTIYVNSLYKKNIERLLNDNSLISYLKKKNIDLIYIHHHNDLYLNRPFNQSIFQYIKFMNQTSLYHYIEQCSLFVTDFSSISFDFMFQNKPTLFYLIDVNDTLNFEEKKYMKNPKNFIYFGNSFLEQNLLIKKIKYFVDINFKIDHELKKKYESIFYFKKNITEKIVDIINKIINK